MALVKTSELSGKGISRPTGDEPAASNVSSSPARGGTSQRRALERVKARQQKAAERIAAATEELASGVAESSSAAEELRRAMEQIASVAEEAAGASQQSLSAIMSLSASFSESRAHAEAARVKTVSVSEEFCRLVGLHPTNVLPVRTINALVASRSPPLWSNRVRAPKVRFIRSAGSSEPTTRNSAGWPAAANMFAIPKRRACGSSASSMTLRLRSNPKRDFGNSMKDLRAASLSGPLNLPKVSAVSGPSSTRHSS